MTAIVYHNPRCSKSRETVNLLADQQIPFATRLYLQDAPSVEEIQQLIKQLGFQSARELMRTKESLYQTMGLDKVT